MSAYLLNDQTFGILAKFAIDNDTTKYGELYGSDLGTVEKVLSELVGANLKSLSTRYPDTKADPALDFAGVQKDIFLRRCNVEASRDWHVSPFEILKSCDCLDYQSCEFDEWTKSTAYKILASIRSSAYRKLDGYEGAQWGYTTDNPPAIVRKMSDLKGGESVAGEVYILGQ
jgi:hypothetical protein